MLYGLVEVVPLTTRRALRASILILPPNVLARDSPKNLQAAQGTAALAKRGTSTESHEPGDMV